MTRFIIPALALILMTTTAVAQPAKKTLSSKKAKLQPAPYFRAGVGYAVSHGGAVQAPVFGYSTSTLLPANGSMSVVSTATGYSEQFDLSRASYTAGVQGVVAFGMMLNKHIGIELAANVGLQTKTVESNLSVDDPNTRISMKTSQQASLPVFITPAVVLQTGGKLNVYARGGVVIPAKAGITQTVDYIENRYNEATGSFVFYRKINWTENFNMRMTPGFSGAMGIKFPVGKSITLWGEAGILSMTLYYQKSELTSLDINGTSVLGQLRPDEKTTRYEFEGTTSSNNNIRPTYQAAYSNFNISAGIFIDL